MVDDEWSSDMQRMVVVIVDTDDQAYEASRALKELADDNLIAVNADGVVRIPTARRNLFQQQERKS